MAESSPKPPIYERPKPFYTLVVLFIAIVIVLSTLSMYFYLRAEDYSDAKYRSQSAIISDMRQHLSMACSELEDVIDENITNSLRELSALRSYYLLDSLTHCADFVVSQYRLYDEQEETFRQLREAFADLAEAVDDAWYSLAIQPDAVTGYQIDSSLSERIGSSIPLLQDLESEFSRALSHENVSRFDEHPSSVVDVMNLELIREIADGI